MTNFEKSKFIFSETFINDNGKTSGSAFIGVILGLVATISWIAWPVLLIVFEAIDATIMIEVMKQTINLVWAAAMLLGARKVASSFSKTGTNSK